MTVSIRIDINEDTEIEDELIVELFCEVTFEVRGLDEFDNELEITYSQIMFNRSPYIREQVETLNEYIAINQEDLEAKFYEEYLKLV